MFVQLWTWAVMTSDLNPTERSEDYSPKVRTWVSGEVLYCAAKCCLFNAEREERTVLIMLQM